MRRLQDRSRSHIDQLLVVEQDSGTTDQQTAVLLHLAERATKQTGTNLASLEKRSVSNLIEVMADERWERLVEQQGIAYAQTIAGALNLKLDADNPADREKLRRAVLDLVAGSNKQPMR